MMLKLSRAVHSSFAEILIFTCVYVATLCLTLPRQPHNHTQMWQNLTLFDITAHFFPVSWLNRPFLSSLCLRVSSLFSRRSKFIFISKLLHGDSFWNRGRKQLGNIHDNISILLFRERLLVKSACDNPESILGSFNFTVSRLPHFRTFWENEMRRHKFMSRAIKMMSRYVMTNMISDSHDVMLHNKNDAIF